METKKQRMSEAWTVANFVKKAIGKPSFVKKDEFIPMVRTADNWMIIVVKFKKKICYHFPLSLHAYTEYKRIMKSWWKQ